MPPKKDAKKGDKGEKKDEGKFVCQTNLNHLKWKMRKNNLKIIIFFSKNGRKNRERDITRSRIEKSRG